MNTKAYKELIEKVKELVFKDGRALYVIAPDIGINDCTLKRFLEGENINVVTLILIADYFEIKLF